MDGITEVQINGVSTNPIMMQLLVEGVLLLMECESAACAALTEIVFALVFVRIFKYITVCYGGSHTNPRESYYWHETEAAFRCQN